MRDQFNRLQSVRAGKIQRERQGIALAGGIAALHGNRIAPFCQPRVQQQQLWADEFRGTRITSKQGFYIDVMATTARQAAIQRVGYFFELQSLLFGKSIQPVQLLSLIHISEPTRLGMISYAVFCLKKKK